MLGKSKSECAKIARAQGLKTFEYKIKCRRCGGTEFNSASRACAGKCNTDNMLEFFTQTEQEMIQRLYLEDFMSVKEVAKAMGVQLIKIQNYLNAIGATRTSQESQIAARARRLVVVETIHSKALRLIGATR